MKNNIFVSILMPTYNGASYVQEAILSVLNQTHTNFELIIVDDASTDNTFELCKAYAKQDTRIRLFQNSNNLGFNKNRNFAIQLANSEFLVWHDQDDISINNRVELQLNALVGDKDIAAVGGHMYLFHKSVDGGRLRRYPVSDYQSRAVIFRYSPVAMPASMMRKSALLRIGCITEKWSPACDLETTFKLGELFKITNIDAPVLYYRIHSKSSTAKYLKQIEVDTLRIRFHYMRSNSYRPSALDYLFNFMHFLSIGLVPGALKIAIFNKIRSN